MGIITTPKARNVWIYPEMTLTVLLFLLTALIGLYATLFFEERTSPLVIFLALIVSALQFLKILISKRAADFIEEIRIENLLRKRFLIK
ncbi:Hypothetical protein FKW44_004507 [Caligus rogercresseyi]|uniref:Uncharacterized protein n=1 Tax=Caligus rogercresseyi TaxID=217165 RepID=A0A7T8HLR7_CALRO|nr:Hypothetical protein FKW44_004507 [Caligus rogercresseyi]